MQTAIYIKIGAASDAITGHAGTGSSHGKRVHTGSVHTGIDGLLFLDH
jgi:hypothetical protein